MKAKNKMNADLSLYAQEQIPLDPRTVARLKVRSVTGYSRDIIYGKVDKVPYKHHYLTFDRLGNRNGAYAYHKEGSVALETTIDNQGNITREINYGPSGNVEYEFRLDYDERGLRTVKSMYLRGEEFNYKFVAERSTDGRLVKDTCIDSKGEIVREDNYEYDNSKLIKINMGHVGERIFDYDKHNNLVYKIGYLIGQGPSGENYKFTYDTKGLLVKIHYQDYKITELKYEFWDGPNE